MQTGRVRCVTETRSLVGEGPVWWAERRQLFFTDINGCSVTSLDPASGSLRRWSFRAPVSALALTSKPGCLLVATGLELVLWQVETDERSVFAQVEDHALGNRLNEGAADPQGDFWVGTMRNNVAPDGGGIEVNWDLPASRTGSVYRISGDGTLSRQLSGLAIPNTMVWTPDGSKMILGDSIDNALYIYDYQRGSISGRQLFNHGCSRGVPDGSAIDSDGFVWNARYFGGCLVRFDPAGQVDRVIEMPVSNVTSCVFGGSDLSTLFITTASLASPARGDLAGAVFALETGVHGLPENIFQLA